MITPPMRGAHGHGGRRATEPQLPPGGTRVVPQIFLQTSGQGTLVRTDGMTPGRLNTCWLTRWLGCSRIWQISELKIGC